MLDYFHLAILLPLAGFLFNGLFYKKISNTVSAVVGISAIAIPFVIVFGTFLDFDTTKVNPKLFILLPWIEAGNFKVDFAYQIDQLSLYMAMIITGIGSLIHLYSVGYMKGEPGFNRFFAYLNLFIFSMLNLVLADNLVLMFLGWEGVGLCSYLLIGFDYHKSSAANAGMKAFIVNRIGDVGFAVGIFATYWFLGSVKYVDIMERMPSVIAYREVIDFVALAFFIGAIGKSAQIPLYVWLPDAMAGPTPVSALIHAATMVTAGVFMIARLNPIFMAAHITSEYIAITGAVTAFFAATIGLYQTDIKKVLAYSTVSQLGYMFLAMGVGAYTAGMFHLMTHAFFKALLFLGSGSVIHAMHHEQDMRNMGNLKGYMKVTLITFLLGTLAISGIPPFSGFFSKDLILEKAFFHHGIGPVLWGIGIAGAVCTAFYMFRLVFLTFFGEERIDHHVKKHLHESPWTITVPLVILAIGSTFAGLLQVPHLFLGGVDKLNNFFAPIFSEGEFVIKAWGIVSHPHEASLSTELILLAVSIGIAVLGIVFSYKIFILDKSVPPEDAKILGFPKVLYNKYYIDELYNAIVVQPLIKLSEFLAKIVDSKFIDGIVEGVGKLFLAISQGTRKIQTGIVGDYALSIVIGTIAILAYLLMRGA
ncbi:MAG: NADH-quinone oxidoreductase subunit L [Leptospiraceae bacterium]|nr:NADH-quinone oxidoreductase subunit L [Leptospiraceae bacterium]MCP5497714.1 NADH-quinone oxidoreductase subunit L [Leptospiraceae bacterium]